MRSFVIATIIICILITIWYSFFSFLEDNIELYTTLLNELISEVKAENWEIAINHHKELENVFFEHQKLYMFFLNHNDIDKVLVTLEKSKQFIENKNKSFSLSELVTLKLHFAHILEKHSLTIVNIM